MLDPESRMPAFPGCWKIPAILKATPLLPFIARLAVLESRRLLRCMSSQLFTVICEFRGGTYVSQVHGHDEQKAFAAWADVLRRDRPMGDDADQIASKVIGDNEPLMALEDVSGVWCWTTNVDGAFLLANIVRSG